MVNDLSGTRSTKALLLTRLRALAGERVSGERLAADIGLSRVAVWKAAESLRAAGYSIEADEHGYRLDPSAGDDFLFPWEFGAREGRVRHWTETSSTMDRAREMADRGGGAGLVLVAERQSAGRGRAGRAWESVDGGLFFTLLLPGGQPIQRYARTGMAVQLAVAAALERLLGESVSLRWPNDVYLDGRKLAGVLTELRGETDRVSWIAVGVGININNPLSSVRAVSCREIAGHPLSRRAVLSRILDEFECGRLRGAEGGVLVEAWNSVAEGIGERVLLADAVRGAPSVTKTGMDPILRTAGVFRGIDAYGRALLEVGSGIIEIEAGLASLKFEQELKDTP